MNEAIEFHDSDVESIKIEGGRLRMLFSEAYIHKSSGRPGIDAGAGYVQAAELLFGEPRVVGALLESIGRIGDGKLVISGKTLYLVPVPFSSTESVCAEFAFTNGVLLSIEAASVSCSTFGDQRFIENYEG